MERTRYGAYLVAGAAVVAMAGGVAMPAIAQQAIYSFDIPSQDLGSALRAYGMAVRTPVAFNGDLTEGKRSVAVRGSYAADEALRQLLGQSDLGFRRGSQGVLLIEARTATVKPASVQMAQAQPPAPAPRPAPVAAPAASAGDEARGLGEIVVTGSRIQVTGYSQPTPVTVVGEQLLERDAKVSIGDTIRELPAVGVSSSPRNGGGAGNIVGGITGVDTVNLRQLGINRTLVLFDGQRVLSSNITGGVDLGLIPSMLVQRVDVVTGGASAAWGSDAVAGVVNLVLNKQFEGVRASIEGGTSYKWDNRSYRLQVAAGTSFDEGRGQVIFAASHLNSPDAVFARDRPYWKNLSLLVNNPAYTPDNAEPRLIHATNVGVSQATQGGLITAGPLRGLQFVGPEGELKPFNFGNVSSTFSNGGDAEVVWPTTGMLTVQYRTTTLFGYGSYELSDSLKASVQLNYGRTWSRNNSVPAYRLGNILVHDDNAFLPQEAKDLMALNEVDSILVGTSNVNNLDMTKPSLDAFEKALGVPVATTMRELKRGVFSLDGKLGGDWTWNAYYQHGELFVDQRTRSNIITPNYAFAVDAVRDPVSGNIVCRATLPGPDYSADAAGCVPLNIFGDGVASAEAIDYVNYRDNFQHIRLKEDVAAASVQGVLPFGLPAGNIATAFGAEYRQEKGNITTSPLAAARKLSVANFSPFSGKYHVKEGFVEVDVPILKDSGVQSLSLNGAVRATDYSTSGTVYTWKVGLTSQVDDNIRLRGTISRDIRAPNLAELFNSGVATRFILPDPTTGEGVSIITEAGGNSNLKPERARTYSAGIVLTPTAIYGLSASLDYYYIKIDGAIYSVGAVQVYNRCLSGETAYCSQLEYDADDKLSVIRLFPLNVNTDETSGIDFQVDYRFPLGAGQLSARALGNYILTAKQSILDQVFNYAGNVGNEAQVQGIPRLRGSVAATYDQGPLSLTGQLRFIGSAKLNNQWTAKDIDDNHVPGRAYVDVRGSWQLNDMVQLFGAVDNLLNSDPPQTPMSPGAGQSPLFVAPIDGTIYDTLGTSFRGGVRLKF